MKKSLAIVAAVVALSAGLIAATSRHARAERAAGDRRNVVLIVVDDMSWSPDEVAVLPHVMQWFGEHGTTYTNFLATNPTCCPFRTSLLMGEYSHHTGCTKTPCYKTFHAAELETKTFPVALQNAGYNTALCGKYLNGFMPPNPEPPGWTIFQGDGGTVANYNYPANVNGTWKKLPAFKPDADRDCTLNAIDTFQQSDQPYFVALTTFAPHNGTNPIAPRYSRAPLPVTWNPTPAFNEADMSDKPRMLQRVKPQYVTAVRTAQGKRDRQLMEVDDAFAQIEGRLSPNDYVIFVSDNGYMHGEHRDRDGKAVPWEESIRVPFMVSGPGVAAGVTDSSVVPNVDIAATIYDASGASPLRSLDGVSLLSNDRPANRASLIETDRGVSTKAWYGVRTDRYVWFTWNGDENFYDLQTDPYEMTGYNATTVPPEYATIYRHLKSLAVAAHTCTDSSCVFTFAEDPITPPTTTTTSTTTVSETSTTTLPPEPETTTTTESP